MGAGAASRGIQGACERDQMQQVFSIDRRKWSYMGATNPWLLQPSMDCSQGGCRRADGRAECGKRGTSWGPNRNRYRKSATAAPSVTDVPVALPSSIFDFVPGTSPSWSLKVWALHSRTLYGSRVRGRSLLYHSVSRIGECSSSGVLLFRQFCGRTSRRPARV